MSLAVSQAGGAAAAAAAGTKAAVELPRATYIIIRFTLIFASLLQTLDSTIANVAMPHIQGALSASQEEITWVLTSYIVAAAIATPMTGWLAAKFGRTKVYMGAVIGFMIASMLCGMSQTLGEIVAFRFLQGAMGAALVPMSQTVMLDITPPRYYGRAMALSGMGIMLGPILGPSLGGWLTENLNWRWVFFINLPFGFLALGGLVAFVKDFRPIPPRPFDFTGFATLSLAVGCFQLMLDRGGVKDWFSSTEIQIYAVVAAVAFYLFVVHTATNTGRSFVNVGLFKDRNFLLGNVLTFLMGSVLFSTLALLPSMMQNLLDYPVVTAGYATAPRGVGTMFGMMLMGRLIERVDVRKLMVIGFALADFALWQMSHFSLQMGMGKIIFSGLIQGLGMGFLWVPLSTMTYATLGQHYRAEGAGIYSLLRNLGNSFGVSVWVTLLTDNNQTVHARLVQEIRPDNPLARPPYIPALLSEATQAQLAQIGAMINRQAAMVAYNDDFWGMIITTLIMLPLLMFLRLPPHMRRESLNQGSARQEALAVDDA